MEQHTTLNQEDDGNKLQLYNWRGRLHCYRNYLAHWSDFLPFELTVALLQKILKASREAIFQKNVKSTIYKAKQSQLQLKNISCFKTLNRNLHLRSKTGYSKGNAYVLHR